MHSRSATPRRSGRTPRPTTAAGSPRRSPTRRRRCWPAVTPRTLRDEIRRVLLRWAYSDRMRGTKEPPDDMASVVRWLETGTIPVAGLAAPGTGPARTRAMLDRISKKKDGIAAAANTANRKRMVLNNALQYAAETNALPVNPLNAVKWTRPRTLKTVDPRTVASSDQARRLLAAVAGTGPRGERMVAFYGCMYYAPLRPEEAVDLRRDNLIDLPDDGWGEMLLTHSEPRSGTSWTDTGLARQRRELKHRAPGETRTVPIHPELVVLLRDHLKRHGTGPGGRIFIGPRGGILTDRASPSSTRPRPRPSPAQRRRRCWPAAPTTGVTRRSPPG